MMPLFRQAAALAACLVFCYPAAANDGDIPKHAERFVRALQEQRFDDAAAMFTPGEKQNPAQTAAQLKRVSTRIGGFATMHNVLSLPEGKTLKLEVPSNAARAALPARYSQVAYTATALDRQPVFYILSFDSNVPTQRVLSFDVHLPIPDAASTKRAEQALRDIL